jgi:site-specific DNA-methyltransferase (adenine-specific)
VSAVCPCSEPWNERGRTLTILREHIADESVDLIYLDPPFNSKRDYNLLFKTPKGHESDAQITAFEDSFLGENDDMMAYLMMMANRLLEMHRVLTPTGSIYLH